MRAVVFIVLVFLLTIGASAQSSKPSPQPADGFLLVEIEALATQDMFTKYVGEMVYLPYTPLAEFFGMINAISDNRDTLTGELPAGTPFRIMRSAGLGVYRGDTLRFDSTTIYDIDGECYIRYTYLMDLLKLRATYSVTDVRLEIRRDMRISALALAGAKYRRASFAVYNGEKKEEETKGESVDRMMFGSLQVGWNLMGSIDQAGGLQATRSLQAMRTLGSTGSLNLTGPFMYGTLSLGGSADYLTGRLAKVDGGLDSWSWQFLLPEVPALRRFTVSSRMLAGRDASYSAELSNQGSTGRPSFGTHVIAGTSSPGWIIELYQGDANNLVQVATADSVGDYAIEIPATYRIEKLWVHQVGPHGERLIDEKVLQVPATLLPPGDLDYNLQIEASSLASDAPARGRGIMTLGLTNWMTLGANGELNPTMWGSLSPDSVYVAPFANFWLGGVSSLSLNYRLKEGMLTGDLSTPLAEDMTLGLGFGGSSLNSFSVGGSTSKSLGGVTVGLSSKVARTGSLLGTEVMPTLSASSPWVSLFASAKVEWQFGLEPAYSVDNSNPLRSVNLRLSSSPLRGVSLSAGGSYDFMSRTVPALSMTSSFRLFSALNMSLGYAVQNLKWSSGIAQLGMSLNIGDIPVTSSSTYDAEADRLISHQRVSGAFMVSAAGLHSPDRYASGGSVVIATGYHDANGNGIRDNDERSLGRPITSIGVNGNSTTSDKGEHFRLSAGITYDLDVDQYSFATDGLFPRRTRFNVSPMPGTVHVVEIPFTEGVDVGGQCMLRLANGTVKTNASSFNMLRVRLTSVDGTAVYDGEIFQDGTVSIVGVARGSYRIELDREQLATRKLAIRSIPETVDITMENTRIADIVFEVAAKESVN